jgi:hypothetical protein
MLIGCFEFSASVVVTAIWAAYIDDILEASLCAAMNASVRSQIACSRRVEVGIVQLRAQAAGA